jgi:hypothetical protein
MKIQSLIKSFEVNEALIVVKNRNLFEEFSQLSGAVRSVSASHDKGGPGGSVDQDFVVGGDNVGHFFDRARYLHFSNMEQLCAAWIDYTGFDNDDYSGQNIRAGRLEGGNEGVADIADFDFKFGAFCIWIEFHVLAQSEKAAVVNAQQSLGAFDGEVNLMVEPVGRVLQLQPHTALQFSVPQLAVACYSLPKQASVAPKQASTTTSIFSRMYVRRHRLLCPSSGIFRVVAASRMAPTRLLLLPVTSAVHAPPWIKSVAGCAFVLITAYGTHRFSSVVSSSILLPPTVMVIGISFLFIIRVFPPKHSGYFYRPISF